jgi:nitrite reductase/ring-hydroxylating ferredoxin subunit
MAFTKVANLSQLPPGQGKQVTVNGKNIALFNVSGTIYAIDDTCPHRGGPLSEGELNGTHVTCPWHAADFDVTTGQHLCPPARSDVAAHKVQVTGDEILVEVT